MAQETQQNRLHTSISPQNMCPKSAIRIAKPFINPPLKSPQSSLNSHYVNQPDASILPIFSVSGVGTARNLQRQHGVES